MNWKTITSTISLVGVCFLISAPGAIAQGAGAPAAKGQSPGGAPGGRGAMAQLSPDQQAKLKAWQKWNEAHKPLRDLSTLIRKVGQLDKEPGAGLTKSQATKLIAIIKPWQTKTTMTNDQASSVMKSVTALLTPAQVTKLATMQGGRGGGGMGGGGRRGGGANSFAPVAVGGASAAPRPSGGGAAPGAIGASTATPRSTGPRVLPPPPAGGAGGAGGGRMSGGAPGSFKIPDPPKTPYNPLNPATLPMEQQRPRAKKSLDEFMAALAAKK